MPKAVYEDDGRRCHACKGRGMVDRHPLMRYQLSSESGFTVVDLHAICVGAWLMANHFVSIKFVPGVVST